MSQPVDLAPYCLNLPTDERSPLNAMARGLRGSTILRIAGEIQAMQAAGHPVCNLTVGDFAPRQFPIPDALRERIEAALRAGETNYPPAIGMPAAREAVRRLYRERLGLDYPLASVVFGSGARPPLYATTSLLLEPGDAMLYGTPSWNNEHYAHLRGARAIVVECDASSDFLLPASAVAAHVGEVQLVALNSPLNPTGTAYGRAELEAICDVILAENRRRAADGRRPVMLMYDQVYWMLTFGDVEHHTPVGLRPEMAAYTIFVDAASKSMAATGLRLGWAVVPPALSDAFKAFIGHMGAWAPRPEQVGLAGFMQDDAALDGWLHAFRAQVALRLSALHDGFTAMGGAGLPVSSIAPQGAIYLSARFDIVGRSVGGKRVESDEDVRQFLLEHAGFGVVPFTAFGIGRSSGWMRLSVGAVSMADIDAGLARIRAALSALDPR